MHYYKIIGADHRKLWECREALEKYLARLKELWDEEKGEWLPSPTSNNAELQAKQLSKMKTLLAKFKVGSTTNFGNNNLQANLSPVVQGSEENRSFSMYTPSGEIKLHITNPDAIDFFEPAHEYYVEFRKAE
jgi:hypothetical protein